MISKLGSGMLAAMLATSVHAQDDWGQKPDQGAAEQLAVAVLQTLLKDPYSAHYRWDEIAGTSTWNDKGPTCYGWVLRGHVNAKNSYGGYVGDRKSVVWGKGVSGRVDLGGRGIIKNRKGREIKMRNVVKN